MSAANTSVTWTYSWKAHGNPSTTIKSRAVDDSGNRESPGAGTTVNVNCPCSIWGTNTTPAQADSGDASATEVGVKFKTDTFGVVTGIRFYKASTNTGTHIGNLWTASGQLLATATFTGESGSGWQQVNFAQPVALDKNTTYVASYFAPKGPLLAGRRILLHDARAGGSHHRQRGQPAASRAAEHQRHNQRGLRALRQ